MGKRFSKGRAIQVSERGSKSGKRSLLRRAGKNAITGLGRSVRDSERASEKRAFVVPLVLPDEPHSVSALEITWGPNRQLLTLLAASRARVLVIGGTAARFHAPERREPNDLDLLVEPSEETAQKILDALETVLGRQLPWSACQLARPSTGFPEKAVLNVDIMTPHRKFGFSEHWALAEEATMVCSATLVRVASIETLLSWLRHAVTVEPNRANGIRDDIELLEEVAQQRPQPSRA